jgi:hypothetical protein
MSGKTPYPRFAIAKRLTPFGLVREWQVANTACLAEAAKAAKAGSLTTEYPANGSSFLNTQCVKEEANNR